MYDLAAVPITTLGLCVCVCVCVYGYVCVCNSCNLGYTSLKADSLGYTSLKEDSLGYTSLKEDSLGYTSLKADFAAWALSPFLAISGNPRRPKTAVAKRMNRISLQLTSSFQHILNKVTL